MKTLNRIQDYFLDPQYFQEIASSCSDQYKIAEPYPHIVIDDFLPEWILDEILQEFPKPETIDWKKFDLPNEKKLASTSEVQMGLMTRFLLYQLNSSIFLNFLEDLTGINDIIPDPYYFGGGLHQIEPGGYLEIHVDFNKHRKYRLDRRLNLLIYLNKDWEEEYGGHFELWDSELTKCEKRVLPIFNRCVIFSTNDFSYHGHPQPLACPEGMTRKSLALYYYSNGRPESEVNNSGLKHGTLFKPKTSQGSGAKDGFVDKGRKILGKWI